MPVRIAINGFGRIGRAFLRAVTQGKVAQDINIVAINQGPNHCRNLDIMFRYDSVMGQFNGNVEQNNTTLTINNHNIELFAEKDPAQLAWKKLNIDWVVEASGVFKTHDDASKHLHAGAKKVLITAPASDADITIVPGINNKLFNAEKHHIVSLGSCTTNCFAPIIKVINNNFEITTGIMTTVHAYTNNQAVLDSTHKDLRRGRAAAINIIPTQTGANKVITQLFPQLEGKLSAIALRVPVPNVSLVDFAFTCKKATNSSQINALFDLASQKELTGILDYSTQPLVSSDYLGNQHSCIVDGSLTQSTGNMHKVFAWYDNEYGYSCRLRDFLLHN